MLDRRKQSKTQTPGGKDELETCCVALESHKKKKSVAKRCSCTRRKLLGYQLIVMIIDVPFIADAAIDVTTDADHKSTGPCHFPSQPY